ncbi:UNVERIFIED_CONTAM: hypothetical protein LK11_25770 [Mumia flava]
MAVVLVASGLSLVPTASAEAEDDPRIVFTRAPGRIIGQRYPSPTLAFELRGANGHDVAFRCRSHSQPVVTCSSPYTPEHPMNRVSQGHVRVEAIDRETEELIAVAERRWTLDEEEPFASAVQRGEYYSFRIIAEPTATFRWRITDRGVARSGFASMDVRVSRTSLRSERSRPWTYPRRLRGITTRSVRVHVKPGQVVCVQPRLRDRVGNQTIWAASGRVCASRVFRPRDHRRRGPVKIVRGKRFPGGRSMRLPPSSVKARISVRVPRRATPFVVFSKRKGDEFLVARGPKAGCFPRRDWIDIRDRRNRHGLVEEIRLPMRRSGRVSIRAGDWDRRQFVQGIGFAPRWVYPHDWICYSDL